MKLPKHRIMPPHRIWESPLFCPRCLIEYAIIFGVVATITVVVAWATL